MLALNVTDTCIGLYTNGIPVPLEFVIWELPLLFNRGIFLRKKNNLSFSNMKWVEILSTSDIIFKKQTLFHSQFSKMNVKAMLMKKLDQGEELIRIVRNQLSEILTSSNYMI